MSENEQAWNRKYFRGQSDYDLLIIIEQCFDELKQRIVSVKPLTPQTQVDLSSLNPDSGLLKRKYNRTV
jgi:hypothetical protein